MQCTLQAPGLHSTLIGGRTQRHTSPHKAHHTTPIKRTPRHAHLIATSAYPRWRIAPEGAFARAPAPLPPAPTPVLLSDLTCKNKVRRCGSAMVSGVGNRIHTLNRRALTTGNPLWCEIYPLRSLRVDNQVLPDTAPLATTTRFCQQAVSFAHTRKRRKLCPWKGGATTGIDAACSCYAAATGYRRKGTARFQPWRPHNDTPPTPWLAPSCEYVALWANLSREGRRQGGRGAGW